VTDIDRDDFRTEFHAERDAMHTPPLSRWQDPDNDGYPTRAYFDAVEQVLTAAGVTIDSAWREEAWEFSFELGGDSTMGYASLYISWRVDEESSPLTGEWEPLHSGICGWYWVPYSRTDTACGDFAKAFDLPVLAEPEQIAAAVANLVKGGDR
jgi:hypothetical protein